MAIPPTKATAPAIGNTGKGRRTTSRDPALAWRSTFAVQRRPPYARPSTPRTIRITPGLRVNGCPLSGGLTQRWPVALKRQATIG